MCCVLPPQVVTLGQQKLGCSKHKVKESCDPLGWSTYARSPILEPYMGSILRRCTYPVKLGIESISASIRIRIRDRADNRRPCSIPLRHSPTTLKQYLHCRYIWGILLFIEEPSPVFNTGDPYFGRVYEFSASLPGSAHLCCFPHSVPHK